MMRRIVTVLVIAGALAAPSAGSAASDRACLGQILKDEVGTAEFGLGTAQEAQATRPFGTNVVSPLAQCQ
jgi:hypothetical protein